MGQHIDNLGKSNKNHFEAIFISDCSYQQHNFFCQYSIWYDLDSTHKYRLLRASGLTNKYLGHMICHYSKLVHMGCNRNIHLIYLVFTLHYTFPECILCRLQKLLEEGRRFRMYRLSRVSISLCINQRHKLYHLPAYVDRARNQRMCLIK